MEDVTYRDIKSDEYEDACAFVASVFRHDVAPYYTSEGTAAFMEFIRPKALASRLEKGGKVILALIQEYIVGLVEVRDGCHVALLFVDPSLQGSGIGRELVKRAVEALRQDQPKLAAVTVNASPNAVGAYERFGFVQLAGGEQVKNGIRFYPMRLTLPPVPR